jgi:hypothetical protein
MLSRIALFSASLAAALVIAGGLALTGLAPQQAQAEAPVAEPAAATAAAPAETPPQVQVDTVYLTPEVAPEVIVTKVVKIAKAHAVGDEGENESGDD